MITGAREVLRKNEVPMSDLHLLVDAGIETSYLKSSIFHEAQIVGVSNTNALMFGSLGERFGVEVFGTVGADQDVTANDGTAGKAAGDRAGFTDNAAGYAVNDDTDRR